jgi:hypothetical protein
MRFDGALYGAFLWYNAARISVGDDDDDSGRPAM